MNFTVTDESIIDFKYFYECNLEEYKVRLKDMKEDIERSGRMGELTWTDGDVYHLEEKVKMYKDKLDKLYSTYAERLV